ncbi:MAG: hypothetical protein M3Q70_02270 [bacterium]|nr:hypothetical protein [bacterium]
MEQLLPQTEQQQQQNLRPKVADRAGPLALTAAEGHAFFTNVWEAKGHPFAD